MAVGSSRSSSRVYRFGNNLLEKVVGLVWLWLWLDICFKKNPAVVGGVSWVRMGADIVIVVFLSRWRLGQAASSLPSLSACSVGHAFRGGLIH